jgi:acyl carrier protein
LQHQSQRCHARCLTVSQLTTQASFTGDLGLDSLDAVEVVMAVEEVCSRSIPQAVALLTEVTGVYH